MVFKRSTESHPNTRTLLVFGWEEANGKYHPVVTDQLPAPEATIEMS